MCVFVCVCVCMRVYACVCSYRSLRLTATRTGRTECVVLFISGCRSTCKSTVSTRFYMLWAFLFSSVSFFFAAQLSGGCLEVTTELNAEMSNSVAFELNFKLSRPYIPIWFCRLCSCFWHFGHRFWLDFLLITSLAKYSNEKMFKFLDNLFGYFLVNVRDFNKYFVKEIQPTCEFYQNHLFIKQ